MISRIEDILWYPTLRCCLNCKRCGEDQDVPQSDEMDCAIVLEKIEESILVNPDATITVTGGEPFMNRSFPTAVLEGLKKTKRSFDITSNGFLFEDIVHLVDQVKDSDRQRLAFHISIDGLKATHNSIRRNPESFDRALSTVKYLFARGLLRSVNTVIQEGNLQELEEIEQFFHDISPEIYCAMGPIGVDCSEDRTYEYTQEYQEKSWKHLDCSLYKKMVLSQGKYRIGHFHAGERNIVVGPDGNVYACLTGAFYRGKDARSKYCLGDLKTATLDSILTNIKQREKVSGCVSSCGGCTDNYTMSMENRIFKLDTGMTEGEVPRALELERVSLKKQSLTLGPALMDTSGWYEVEKDGGRNWCWSNGLMTNVFIPTSRQYTHVIISFSKITQDQKVKVFVDGAETDSELSGDGHNITMKIPCVTEKDFITVTFLVDKLWSPSELFDSMDSRKLGICLTDVQLVE